MVSQSKLNRTKGSLHCLRGNSWMIPAWWGYEPHPFGQGFCHLQHTGAPPNGGPAHGDRHQGKRVLGGRADAFGTGGHLHFKMTEV